MTNPAPSGYDTYTSPLASRNASPEMLKIWSPRHKFNTWRRIWLAIAEAQHEVTKDWGSESSSERARSASEGSAGDPSLARASGSSKAGPLVTKEQVEELRSVVERGITDEELARASEIERDLRHDVMAHVHCLGESCPKAKPIIHLGCTSQDVVCNADILMMREAISNIEAKLVRAIVSIGENGRAWGRTPTLGFTHYQVAQPVTVGRRCCNWASDLRSTLVGVEWSEFTREAVKMRGLRGATGTQASFLALFGGDQTIVDRFEVLAVLKMGCRQLEEEIGGLDEASIDATRQANIEHSLKQAKMAEAIGDVEAFEMWRKSADQLSSISVDDLIADRVETGRWYLCDVVGQTYPRVADTQVLSSLASIAAVLHKIATDIRLLSNRKEIDEPFGKNQIGSSAMPYKRNPMKREE